MIFASDRGFFSLCSRVGVLPQQGQSIWTAGFLKHLKSSMSCSVEAQGERKARGDAPERGHHLPLWCPAIQGHSSEPQTCTMSFMELRSWDSPKSVWRLQTKGEYQATPQIVSINQPFKELKLRCLFYNTISESLALHPAKGNALFTTFLLIYLLTILADGKVSIHPPAFSMSSLASIVQKRLCASMGSAS